MKDLYEVIQYTGTNYTFSVARADSIVPHIHREAEVGTVLEGSMHLLSSGKVYALEKGDFWLMNPYQCHENKAANPGDTYVSLVLQVPVSFFKDYYPKMSRITMNINAITKETIGEKDYSLLHEIMLSSAKSYFHQERNYELLCAANINLIFKTILDLIPFVVLSEEELKTLQSRMGRIQRITDYIEEHCGEKLLLSEIADKEGLALNYLSHSFREYFGMPFQSYLQNQRCQKAAALLVETDSTLSDISYACGFSALKYMNKAFKDLFGMEPREYRKLYAAAKPAGKAAKGKERNPAWFHLSKEASMDYLDRLRE